VPPSTGRFQRATQEAHTATYEAELPGRGYPQGQVDRAQREAIMGDDELPEPREADPRGAAARPGRRGCPGRAALPEAKGTPVLGRPKGGLSGADKPSRRAVNG
jgi:hypothetical protein